MTEVKEDKKLLKILKQVLNKTKNKRFSMDDNSPLKVTSLDDRVD